VGTLSWDPRARNQRFFSLASQEGRVVLRLSDAWTLTNLSLLAESIAAVQGEGGPLPETPPACKGFRPVPQSCGRLEVDGQDLKAVDSAGAMLLFDFAKRLGIKGEEVELLNFQDNHVRIIKLVFERLGGQSALALEPQQLSLVAACGRSFLRGLRAVLGFLGFLGESTIGITAVLRRPALFRLKEFFVQLELVCLDAIPVVSLVTFLIGVVIAYLLAMQVEKYGANIYIVNGVGLAMCRELSPIIVAIIMAGRSGSAFTAQLGAMKLNEEIDALVALGLSPIRVLVLPRLLALVIAMPLLVFIGDVVGIAGGMLVAESYLGITFPTFIERLQIVLPFRAFAVGLVKAPAFAVLIALIGCRMGLAVENNARSVGLNTTSTVVQSIVVVILLNALFAVIFANLGI